jgi:ribose transport system ATP-binding protein
MGEVLLRVEKMSKSFGPTKALQEVDLTVYRGEIRGFVGENGSGKSTLSSIVAGIQKCDSGKMYKDGEPYAPDNVVEAQSRGVAMIVQEMGTVPNIGIADNIFLGREREFRKGSFLDQKAMIKAADKILAEIGAEGIDASKSINTLNLEARKIVEIARAMYSNPDLLIVDESTTALSQHGRDIIYNIMRKMRDSGKSILFISHDLDELIEICSGITVLRDGQMIGTLEKDEITVDRLRTMMVGRELKGDYYRSDYDSTFGEKVVLKAENITDRRTLKGVSIELHEGEILGIGGLSDSGMHELGRAVFGIDKLVTGRVMCGDTLIDSPYRALEKRIGYVSKNRDLEALFLRASIKVNITYPSLDYVSDFKIISPKKEKEFVQKQVEALKIKCNSIEQEVRSLSGGNKQKVVFGKWIGNNSKILILDCPTRGVDVGVKAAMYQLMASLKRSGTSILLISEELPELIGMSDRIILMKAGEIVGEFMRSPALTEHDIIHKII